MSSISEAARAVEQMDKHLRDTLLKKDGLNQEKKLWENTYIKHQIDKRNGGGSFSINDHIQGMVYSLLSSERGWEKIEDNLEQINTIFLNFDSKRIKVEPAENFEKEILNITCGNRRIHYQMQALRDNIEKLELLENQYSSIDAYYQKFIEEDATLKSLVMALSGEKSKDKIVEMGIPLASEYLRNVGYDIPKPDTHITRILGSKVLACSEHEIVPEFEAFDIVAKISKELNKPVAEVDYILWLYCADGYGEICTASKPKCEQCAAKAFCTQ